MAAAGQSSNNTSAYYWDGRLFHCEACSDVNETAVPISDSDDSPGEPVGKPPQSWGRRVEAFDAKTALPDELWSCIFSFTSLRERQALHLTCQYFRQINNTTTVLSWQVRHSYPGLYSRLPHIKPGLLKLSQIETKTSLDLTGVSPRICYILARHLGLTQLAKQVTHEFGWNNSNPDISCLTWSPDNFIGPLCHAGKLAFWKPGEREVVYDVATDSVTSMHWQPELERIAAGFPNGRVGCIDYRVTTDFVFMPEQHSGGVQTVALNRDGSLLASGASDGTVKVWCQSVAGTYRSFGTIKRIAPLCLSWCMGGQRLACGSKDSNVYIWDKSSRDLNQPVGYLSGHMAAITQVAWSSSGRLASASEIGGIAIWDLGQSSQAMFICWLKVHVDAVVRLSWNCFGLLMSCSADTVIRVWDIDCRKKDKCIYCLRVKPIQTDIAWHPDGCHLATIENKERVVVWDESP